MSKHRHRWSAEQTDLLRAQYPHRPTSEIAVEMGLPLEVVYRKASFIGLRKSEEFCATSKSGRILKGGKLSVATQFKPGNIGWNKGLKGWKAGGRSALTRFKPGVPPPNVAQIGDLRTVRDKSGKLSLQQKTSNAKGPSNMRWTPVARLVWERAHGPVPANHIVMFKPGMRTTVYDEITLDRLECVSRAEQAKRHHPFHDKEMGKLYQLKGQIHRVVNQMQRQQEQTA